MNHLKANALQQNQTKAKKQTVLEETERFLEKPKKPDNDTDTDDEKKKEGKKESPYYIYTQK